MKNKLVKGFVTLSLATVLALSGVTTMGDGSNVVEAAKIVNYKTLAPVTGISYNAKSRMIYWNKVPGATRYEVTVTYPDGSTSTDDVYGDLYSYWGLSKGTYKITVKAYDGDSLYVIAKDVKLSNKPANYEYSESNKVGNDWLYTFYGCPTSQGATQIVVTEDTSKQTVTDKITAIPGMVIKEANEDRIIVKPTSSVKLNYEERIEVEYSNNPEFKRDSSKGLFSSTATIDEYDTSQNVNIYLSNFEPGETIYVRARVYNYYYGRKWHEYKYEENGITYTDGYWVNDVPTEQRYSAYTKVLTYAVKKAKISYVSTTTTANSVTIGVETTGGAVTGYQFEKKVGSKWVTLDTQTDPYYVDSALVKNTKYQYRVRAYTYNKKTNKTLWTDWYTVDTTTWGTNLNVKAAANSATSVKVTWKPVTGAEGYEIYRYDNGSSGQTKDKGVWLESAGKKYLVKTIKKAKAKSYTEKKLSKNSSYTYVVRAYRTVGKQKVYLEGSASVSLRASYLNVDTYVNAKGQTIAYWDKKTGIKGYYVEQYDRVAEEYKTIKTLKASATTYTFPKVAVGSESVAYRIRPYDAATIYGGEEISVYGTLAAPTSVKATKTATGVQISWKPVAGADYYQVYRTNSGSYDYDKTRKTYNYYGASECVYEAAVNTTNCHPELGESSYKSAGTYKTTQIRGTSVEDKTLTYQARVYDDKDEPIKVGQTTDGQTIYKTEDKIYVEGPEAGTTYHYYVVAYAQAANGYNGATVASSDSKAAKITYTNAIAKKVSKIASAKSSKKGQATISYKKVKGVDGYAIYRSTKKNGTYVLVGTSTKTKFTDASAPTGKKCYYKVASYVKGEKKANIYSAKTAAKEVKIK